ncbi:Polynucleotide adenylyltransferase region [Crinalium epipsammum PCC 9333]|uniref:Polynucleotide adenylyltransferase region n=1 Tax=Crinalium epipsammum PCC 9333 TaxID=1173022 RepID=K9W4Z5_9CYAN|nr:CCA tRNA nucleotidyltransferase [Crinalium epipsammum]AFZ15266.1 Polynucleotide adenylyltransferase region [Crinalium epipsammum PCC 9333]
MFENSSALSPQNLPFSLELLPQPAYLVGGAVRDALLGRSREYLDLDFVIANHAVQTARKIAREYKAGFVLLDAERQIARVVFKHATVDFAQQEGAIETDLQRRDFTVNAIAYNPYTKEIIDPLNGYADLQLKIMRMVAPANLQDDPLRLLRAYRQAAQLSFVIEPTTKSTIRQLARLISEVAAERVLTELRYLLKTPQGTHELIAAVEDGLLSTWFPNVTNEGLAQLIKVDQAAELLGKTWSNFKIELVRSLRDTINTSLVGIAKLVNLLPATPPEAELQMLRLSYSRPEIKAVTTAITYLPQLQAVAQSEMSLAEQYFFFQNVKAVFPAIAVLAVGSGIDVDAIAPLINRYLNPEDQVAHPTSLVSGNDLMQALKLPPSPQVGKLLTDIQIARIEGKIATPAQALELAAQIVNNFKD